MANVPTLEPLGSSAAFQTQSKPSEAVNCPKGNFSAKRVRFGKEALGGKAAIALAAQRAAHGSKGAERSFQADPERARLKTEWSGFRSDVVTRRGFEPRTHCLKGSCSAD